MSGAGAHVVRAHRTAAAAVPEDQPLHLEPARRELRAQPELLEEAGALAESATAAPTSRNSAACS